MGQGGVRHMDAGHLGGSTDCHVSVCVVSHASCIIYMIDKGLNQSTDHCTVPCSPLMVDTDVSCCDYHLCHTILR
jgi:hypothetical protein